MKRKVYEVVRTGEVVMSRLGVGWAGRVREFDVTLPAGEVVATHRVRETAERHVAKNNANHPEGRYVVREIEVGR